MFYRGLLWCLLFGNFSFAQGKKNEISVAISEKYAHINAENIVDKLVSKIKNYDREVEYFIRPVQTNCLYELLVNDVLMYKDYTIEKLSSPVEINDAILKSGPQTVTVRMYPMGDAIKEAYGKGETITTLQRNSDVSIKVVKYDAFNISDELDDEIIVLQHNSPTNEDTDNFLGDGLPYYEYTFTFNAEVPYELEGWSKGEDLTKFDKEELEAAVVKYYKNYQSIYKKEDEDALAKSIFGELVLLGQVHYKNKIKLQKVWEEVRGNLEHRDKDFGNLDNYNVNLRTQELNATNLKF